MVPGQSLFGLKCFHNNADNFLVSTHASLLDSQLVSVLFLVKIEKMYGFSLLFTYTISFRLSSTAPFLSATKIPGGIWLKASSSQYCRPNKRSIFSLDALLNMSPRTIL